MSSYRREITANGLGNVTPKLHLLEDHVVDAMRRKRCALGFIGEQGFESIHHQFNDLERQHSATRNELERLEQAVKEHA